jgi:hypothetical protein
VNTTSINMQTIESFRPFFNDDFIGWLTLNQHIYEAFERQALLLIARGRSHYSARTIVEVLVHHSILAEKPGGGFKIRNDVAPDLARVFAIQHPQHALFWEYRRSDRLAFLAKVMKLNTADGVQQTGDS